MHRDKDTGSKSAELVLVVSPVLAADLEVWIVVQ
jgi:hypothetical protein